MNAIEASQIYLPAAANNFSFPDKPLLIIFELLLGTVL